MRTQGNVIGVMEAEGNGCKFKPAQVFFPVLSGVATEALGRRRDLRHPPANKIARRQRFLFVRKGPDTAAQGVAKHDDMLHPQSLNGKFERRAGSVLRVAIGGRFVGRDQVGDVAYDQQFARSRIENHLRRYPGVHTSHDHDFGPLPGLGQALVARTLRDKAAVYKGIVPLR